MGSWSTDKIAVAGMVAALLVSIITGAWTGREDTLAASIVTGIFGYIRGAAEARKSEEKSNTVKTLEKVESAAANAKIIAEAVDDIKKTVKK